MYRERRASVHRIALAGASVGTILAVASLATPSAAADAANAPAAMPNADSGAVEAVIVTANKRAENVQEVPISINAFTGDRIAKTGSRSIVDIQFLAAGLNFGQDRAGTLRTSIRGINSNVGTESGVATHVDGVYLENRYDQVGAFFDVKRVEVLRGPQGTLYGRNATGGAINIITNDPTHDSEAGAQLTVGNYSLVESEGYASGPVIGDKVLGRIAFKTTSLPGYGVNLLTGERVNGDTAQSVRGKVQIFATDNLTIKLSADYTHSYSTYADEISRLFPQVPLVPESAGLVLNLANPATNGFVMPTGFNSARNRPNFQDVRGGGISAREELNLGFATLSSLTAYRRISKQGAIDIDGAPSDEAYFKVNDLASNQISEELNLTSASDSKLKWIFGAFYLRNHQTTNNDVPLPALGTAEIFSRSSYLTNAYAVFGEASYPVLPRLTLTLGGRYSNETSHDVEFRQVAPGPVSSVPPGTNTSHAFTPKVSLEFKATDDVNLYATYAQGFKSGGLNAGNNDPSNFLPEHVTNYEIGVKSMLFDRRVMANLSAFYMKYRDLQVSSIILIPPGTPAVRTVNAASATIKGVEGDFRAIMTDHLSLDGNFSYLDANYDDFSQASDGVGAVSYPFSIPPDLSNYPGAKIRSASGNQMVGAPRFALNLGGEYKFPVASWNGVLRLEYAYQSTVYFTPWENLRGIEQKPVGVFNARVTLTNPGADWTVALWGRNLTDERIISSQADSYDNTVFTGLFKSTTYRPPRTFGVTIGKHF